VHLVTGESTFPQRNLIIGYERFWGTYESQAGLDCAHSFGRVAIYLVVASILAWLVSLSRCARERIYFAFCASSATFGLLRSVFGDSALPAAQYMRVVMLSSAVVVGTLIFRSFSRPVPEQALSE
jgi:hypothetical protein